MNFKTETQLRTFQKIHKKYPVSIEFLKFNSNRIIKLLKYLLGLHFILKCKLIKRDKRVIIKYNSIWQHKLTILKKSDTLKKKKKTQKIPWTKQVALYLKRLHLLEKVRLQNSTTAYHSDSTIERDEQMNIAPDEIQAQLKAQLQLLNERKKPVPLLEEMCDNIVKQKSNFSFAYKNFVRKTSSGNLSSASFEINEKDAAEASSSTNLSESLVENTNLVCSNIDEEIRSPRIGSLADGLLQKIYNLNTNEFQQQKSFVDGLINKIKTNAVTNLDSSKIENSNESKCDTINDADSDSSGDFLGFPKSEISLPTQMLSNPHLVGKNNSLRSAFISEELDNFMRENSLETSTEIKFPSPKKIERIEDGMVSLNSVPPKFSKPVEEKNAAKPRTVAEKRVFLQKNKNFKYFMIENENTIYRELKRRSKSKYVNFNLIRHVQCMNAPASRDLWKAMSWLSTETNNFFFQMLKIDNNEVKLISGLGNHTNKYLKPTTSFPEKKKKECNFQQCRDFKEFSFIKVRNKIKDSINRKPRLMEQDKMKKLPSFKPGPLSYKCQQMKNFFEPNLGNPELLTMPKIQLEVFPRIDHPLSDLVKRYLKLILPSKNITKEWAEFAVSTLLVSHADFKRNQEPESFSFTIPYQNDQNKVLIRRIYKNEEIFDDFTSPLVFREKVKDSDDKILVECADVLSEMIDSVALGINGDLLIKDESNDVPVATNVETEEKTNEIYNLPSKKKKTNAKTKLYLELKRLNATIIETADPEDLKPCNRDCCRLGCICHSLNGRNSIRRHCQKVECMFECNCSLSILQPEDFNSELSTEEALVLRQQATATLARMEREFTSTVVLTNTETVLINESQTERKRRCTKRFGNFASISDDEDELKTSDSSRNKKRPLNVSLSPVKEAKISPNDITYVDLDTFEKLKHCSVDLNNLQMKSLRQWCMVHCLYKCFCGCNDIEGVPFVLKKENMPAAETEVAYARTPKYSFETAPTESDDDIDYEEYLIAGDRNKSKKRKLEINREKVVNKSIEKSECIKLSKYKKLKPAIIKADDNSKSAIENEIGKNSQLIAELSRFVGDANDPIDEDSGPLKRGRPRKFPKTSAEDLRKENIILTKYTNNDAIEICRRVIRVPLVYKWRNKRKEYVKQKTNFYVENTKTAKLLEEKIRLSEFYKQIPQANPLTRVSENRLDKLFETRLGNELGNEIDEIPTHFISSNEISCKNIYNSIKSKEYQALEQPLEGISRQGGPSSSSGTGFLKISSVVSLGAKKLPTLTQHAKTTTTKDIQHLSRISSVAEKPVHNTNLLKTAPEFNISDTKESERPGHDNILAALNYAVTKTMHNICQIQLKNTKNIPSPLPEHLYISQWQHFQQAFTEGLIHIWEVKVDDTSYFTITMQNIMPFILGQVHSVVNIKAIKKENLSFFGKLLCSETKNPNFNSLSVLLTGFHDYWRILGMSKASIDYVTRGGVIKPTPQSHPWLSKKINKLYEYMAKQHISEMQAKFLEKQKNKELVQQLQQQTGRSNNILMGSAIQSMNPNCAFLQLQNHNFYGISNLTTATQVNPIENSQNNIYENKNEQYQSSSNQSMFKNNLGNIQFVQQQSNDDLNQMNIKIRKLSEQDIRTEKFTIPLTPDKSDHRWLILDIVDDFSHMYFADTNEWFTHNKIRVAFKRSQEEHKMVRLSKVDGHSIDCYIMKNDKDRLYLGPFSLNQDPVIILYQCVNNQMMKREFFEEAIRIRRLKSTTGFWLCRKSGKIVFDIDPKVAEPPLNKQIRYNKDGTLTTESIENIVKLVPQQNLKNPNPLIRLEQPQYITSSNSNPPFDIRINLVSGQQQNLTPIKKFINLPQNEQNLTSQLVLKTHLNTATTFNLNPSLSITNSRKTSNISPHKIVGMKSQNITEEPQHHLPNKSLNTSEKKCLMASDRLNKSFINLKSNINPKFNILNGSLTMINPGNYEITSTKNPENIFPTNLVEVSTKTVKPILLPNIEKDEQSVINMLNTEVSDSSLEEIKNLNIIKFYENIESSETEKSNHPNESFKETSEVKNNDFAITNVTSLATNSETDLSTLAFNKIKSSAFSIKSVTSLAKNQNDTSSFSQNGFDQADNLIPFSIISKGGQNDETTKKTSVEESLKNHSISGSIDSYRGSVIDQSISVTENRNKSTLKSCESTVKHLTNFGIAYPDGVNCGGPEAMKQFVANISTNKSVSISPIRKNKPLPANKEKTLQKINRLSSINIRDPKKSSLSEINLTKKCKTITGFYVCPECSEYPRFGGLKKDSCYLIRTNSNSALQLSDLDEVSGHLNKHIKKHNRLYNPLYENVKWTFVPFLKASNRNIPEPTIIVKKKDSNNTQPTSKMQHEDPLKTVIVSDEE